MKNKLIRLANHLDSIGLYKEADEIDLLASKIINFPTYRQVFEYDCGACALQTIIVYYLGKNIKESDLLKQLKTNKRTGTKIENIIKVSKKHGLNPVSKTDATIEEIRKSISNNHPVLLCLQAYSDDGKNMKNTDDDGHYVVAIGIDADRIIFEDPNDISRTYLSDRELEERWHHKEGNKTFDHWMCVFNNTANKDQKIVHMD